MGWYDLHPEGICIQRSNKELPIDVSLKSIKFNKVWLNVYFILNNPPALLSGHIALIIFKNFVKARNYIWLIASFTTYFFVFLYFSRTLSSNVGETGRYCTAPAYSSRDIKKDPINKITRWPERKYIMFIVVLYDIICIFTTDLNTIVVNKIRLVPLWPCLSGGPPD